MSNKKKVINTKPFLKWAGGKRWFVTNHSDLFPQNFNRYIEPFLGSGAVFFHLQPHNAFLGDSNKDLIDTYRAIRREWKLVYRYLRAHHTKHSKEYYYQIRTSRPISPARKAARFIYLNRTCWNGLYRVNLSGVFNVPIGTKSTVVFSDDNFQQVSDLLCNATLYNCDFEKLIDFAEENDLVFVDPPYTVRHNHNAFIKYNEKLFSWADQERLFASLSRAKQRGVQIIATNAYHQCVRDLYDKSFSTIAVKRNSSISSKIATRRKFNELVIYTEKINE
ncbi:DNA adenine methylase [Desulfonatronum zhilinae]|nr:DNA adenine methylase [Desulfonatronum zhilinae]